MQDQIGKRLRAARPRLPGRLQEVPGDRHPREMITVRYGGYKIRLIARPNFFTIHGDMLYESPSFKGPVHLEDETFMLRLWLIQYGPAMLVSC